MVALALSARVMVRPLMPVTVLPRIVDPMVRVLGMEASRTVLLVVELVTTLTCGLIKSKPWEAIKPPLARFRVKPPRSSVLLPDTTMARLLMVRLPVRVTVCGRVRVGLAVPRFWSMVKLLPSMIEATTAPTGMPLPRTASPTFKPAVLATVSWLEPTVPVEVTAA